MSTWRILKVQPPAFANYYEFAVRDQLHIDHNLEAVAPPRITFCVRKGKKVPMRRPLIPGYVFAKFAAEHWEAIKRIQGVRGIMQIGGALVSLTPTQIEAVEALASVEENKSRFSHGDRLRIRRGAMAELKAVVADMNDRGQVVADVTMFNRTFRKAFDSDQVEIIPPVLRDTSSAPARRPR